MFVRFLKFLRFPMFWRFQVVVITVNGWPVVTELISSMNDMWSREAVASCFHCKSACQILRAIDGTEWTVHSQFHASHHQSLILAVYFSLADGDAPSYQRHPKTYQLAASSGCYFRDKRPPILRVVPTNQVPWGSQSAEFQRLRASLMSAWLGATRKAHDLTPRARWNDPTSLMAAMSVADTNNIDLDADAKYWYT
jgi:hypothetical protein